MTKRYSSELAYGKDEEHLNNISNFEKIISSCGISENVFFANYEKAPWHVQYEANGETLNFWPHKMKAQIQYQPYVAEGFDQCMKLTVEFVQGVDVELIE